MISNRREKLKSIGDRISILLGMFFETQCTFLSSAN